ncbi:hypothetical protein H0H87_009344 [Tephrocybe sp. NHM501043]|nr:hypothetical protein H0H87_009344 [Tephrocybe sp. NHM501043]
MSDGDNQRPVDPASPEPGPSADIQQPLSKKAQKRAAKAERHAVYKLERRAKEKEAKKEKKRAIQAKRAAGELDEDEDKKRQKKKPRLHFGGRVVVDLGFDDKMNEKEIISLCSQLAYTYSANRNAAYPFSLLYTSINGRTFNRLEGMNDAGYKRWSHTEWWREGYERIWQGEEPSPPEEGKANEKLSEADAPAEPSTSAAQSTKDVRQSVVYLTADSEEELTELKPNETYIIGGICDHNRYKNLCLDKAKGSGVRTARLPIGRYLASLPTRKVLTVNQVFEILLKWVETRNWEEALYSVVPKRKFHTGGKGGSSTAKLGGQAGDPDDRAEEAGGADLEEVADSSAVIAEEKADVVEEDR